MAFRTLALLLALCLPAHGSEPQAMPDALVFNISMEGYPPFTILDDQGQISGIFWDLLASIAARHDIDLTAVQLPSKRVEQMLLEGHLDVTMRAREWTEHPDQFVFSEPVLETRDAIFVHRNHRGRYRTADDLEGKLVLTQLGFRYPELNDALSEGRIHYLEIQDQSSMFRRLLQGQRFDAAISNLDAGLWLIREQGWQDQIELADVVFTPVPYRLMFAPAHRDFVEKILNPELRSMAESGELEAIRDRYR